jgi:hypothetical protein
MCRSKVHHFFWHRRSLTKYFDDPSQCPSPTPTSFRTRFSHRSSRSISTFFLPNRVQVVLFSANPTTRTQQRRHLPPSIHLIRQRRHKAKRVCADLFCAARKLWRGASFHHTIPWDVSTSTHREPWGHSGTGGCRDCAGDWNGGDGDDRQDSADAAIA